MKSKKIFLKKSPCPPELSKVDFVVGGKVLLYSRELELIDYGDIKTKEKLHYQIQHCFIILTPETYSNWGKICTLILDELNLHKMKSVIMPGNAADSVCKILNVNSRMSSVFSSGTCVAIVANAEDGFNKLYDIEIQISKSYGKIFISQNNNETSELTSLLIDGPISNSCTLDSCTCCIIKPHAVKNKSVGPIMDIILSQGYEISAIRTLLFEKIQAEEFLEVYKGVIPDYPDQVSVTMTLL